MADVTEGAVPGEGARYAFVLISFESAFDDVFKTLIAEPLEAHGYVVERADSRLDQVNILQKIVQGIARADLIVADLTGLNANVFYELGIAHSLGIPTILLTQDIESLPFDLRSYTANEYSTHFAEASKIVQTIGELGTAHLEGQVVFGSPVSDFLPPDLREQVGRGPRRGAPSASGAAVPEPEGDEPAEELGFVDLELQAMQAGDQFKEAMEAVTEATEKVGEQIEGYTAEIEALATNPGPQNVKAANSLALRMAHDLDEYADAIQAQLPDIQEGAEKLMDSINRRTVLWREIEGSADREQLVDTRDTLSELRETTGQSVEFIRGFRDSMQGTRGFSRHVNNASARIVKALNSLITVSENVEAQSARAVAVISDLLDELGDDDHHVREQ